MRVCVSGIKCLYRRSKGGIHARLTSPTFDTFLFLFVVVILQKQPESKNPTN